MNWKAVVKVLGKILLAEAAMLLLPIVVCAISGENTYWSFLFPILILLVMAIPTFFLKAEEKEKTIYAKEGFAIVAFSWLAMSVVGAVPFVVSNAIPNYVDALFETISGFTTTGASILQEVESLPRSILFWRSFTNWIGGMGVLVFVLAVLPRKTAELSMLFARKPPAPTWAN